MELSVYHETARLEDSYWWFRGRRAILAAVLRHWLPSQLERQILDVGCGTGAMLEMLREHGRVEGLDCSPEALEYCRSRLGGEVPLHLGFLPDGVPRDRRYDAITAFDVIEHLSNPVAVLTSLRCALAPGGILIVTVPAFMFLWGPHDAIAHHCRRYSPSLLISQLRAAGFRVRWHSFFNTFLFPPIAAVRLMRQLIGGSNRSATDNVELHPVLNSCLETVFASERFLAPYTRLPFGVSLVAIAQSAPEDPHEP